MRNPIDRLTHRLPQPWRIAADWALTLTLAVAIVLVIKVEVANPYRIPSASMEPTLHCARPAQGCLAGASDRVIANRFIYRFREPRRGEIVVYETPSAAKVRYRQGGTFVKRLIGLPGEVVSQRDGYFYVDGQRLHEAYVEPRRRDSTTETWPRIPRDHYFIVGDIRVSSCDSRQWGSVPRGNLIGPVMTTYWPPGRISIN